MHSSRISKILAGLAFVAAFGGGGVATAGVVGVVTEVTKQTLIVSGARYEIEEGTSLVDQNERPIALPELRPGVPVELEFDEEGNLGVVRATVVR